jgi:hypothetical protein
LNIMEEIDKLGIAYVYEACDVIQDEVNIAERCYRQMILIMRAYHLRFLKAQDRLHKAQQQRNLVVMVAHGATPNSASAAPFVSDGEKNMVLLEILHTLTMMILR